MEGQPALEYIYDWVAAVAHDHRSGVDSPSYVVDRLGQQPACRPALSPYIYPTQINALASSDPFVGNAEVQMIARCAGVLLGPVERTEVRN